MRILPHYQDTGGFFLAVIRKLKPLKTAENQVKVEKESLAVDANGDALVEDEQKPPPKKRRFFGFREDPFLYFKEDEPTWTQIQ
jgi:tRNA (cytosine34-C5)-methyltransferase